MKLQDWLALAVNLLLVIVTAAYVVLTWWLAKSAKTSADWARRAAEATRDAAQATRRQAELAAGSFPIAFHAVLGRPLDEHTGDPNNSRAQLAKVLAELDPEIGSKRSLTIRNSGGRVYFQGIGTESVMFDNKTSGRDANTGHLDRSQKPRYFDPGTEMEFEYSPIDRQVEIDSMSIEVLYTLEPDEPIRRRMPVAVEVVRQSAPI